MELMASLTSPVPHLRGFFLLILIVLGVAFVMTSALYAYRNLTRLIRAASEGRSSQKLENLEVMLSPRLMTAH